MKRLMSIALAAGLAAPAAFAGGIQPPLEEPRVFAPVAPPPASFNWTGPYAGVTLGVGRASSSGGGSETGVGGGLHLGYNMDMGNWVAGGEVDVAPSAFTRLDFGGLELREALRLKLRAGPKLGATGNTFAFGTVGAAHVRTSGAGGSNSDNGWLAGVGVSHAFTDTMFVTGELLHHRFRNVAGTTNNVNANTASVGVSFRF